MGRSHIITAVIMAMFTIGAFVIAVLQFCKKGPVIANSYFLASPQERKQGDWKSAYRLSAIVFSWLGVLCLLVTIALISGLSWLYTVVIIGGVALGVYVIVRTIRDAARS